MAKRAKPQKTQKYKKSTETKNSRELSATQKALMRKRHSKTGE